MAGSRPARDGGNAGGRRRKSSPAAPPDLKSATGRGPDALGDLQASTLNLFRANAEAGWAWWSALAAAPSPEAAWRDGSRIAADAVRDNVEQVRRALDATARLLDGDPPAPQARRQG